MRPFKSFSHVACSIDANTRIMSGWWWPVCYIAIILGRCRSFTTGQTLALQQDAMAVLTSGKVVIDPHPEHPRQTALHCQDY